MSCGVMQITAENKDSKLLKSVGICYLTLQTLSTPEPSKQGSLVDLGNKNRDVLKL